MDTCHVNDVPPQHHWLCPALQMPLALTCLQGPLRWLSCPVCTAPPTSACSSWSHHRSAWGRTLASWQTGAASARNSHLESEKIDTLVDALTNCTLFCPSIWTNCVQFLTTMIQTRQECTYNCSFSTVINENLHTFPTVLGLISLLPLWSW